LKDEPSTATPLKVEFRTSKPLPPLPAKESAPSVAAPSWEFWMTKSVKLLTMTSVVSLSLTKTPSS
jgi:hypothetical protein